MHVPTCQARDPGHCLLFGDASQRLAVQVDSGEIPEPTVIVRMGEGRAGCRWQLACFDMRNCGQIRLLALSTLLCVSPFLLMIPAEGHDAQEEP